MVTKRSFKAMVAHKYNPKIKMHIIDFPKFVTTIQIYQFSSFLTFIYRLVQLIFPQIRNKKFAKMLNDLFENYI